MLRGEFIVQKETNYNYIIDALKFVFSFIIVIYHSWCFSGTWGNGYFQYGFLAVDFYFIVTGYLMMNSINKEKNQEINLGKSTLCFVKNKIKKIYPFIIVSFLVGGFLLFKENFLIKGIILKNEYLLEILQLGILGTGFPINSAAWYLSSMLISLLLLYPLAKKFKENYNTLIVPITLVVIILIVNSFQININNPLGKDLFFLNGFYKGLIFILIGNLTFFITQIIKKINFKKTGIILLTFLEIVLYILSILTMYYNMFDTGFVAIMLQIAIAITFSNKSLTFKYLNFSIFKKLGEFGFIMYLNNIYIRTYFLQNNLIKTYKETTLLYLGVVLLISLIIYFLVPVIVKLLKFFRKKFIGLCINS